MEKLAQIDFKNLTIEQNATPLFKLDSTLTLGVIISFLTKYIFAFAGLGLLTYLIMGGFKLMTAAGDPKKMQEGQHTISNAFIGFAIIFIAFIIVQFIAKVLVLNTILTI